MNIQNHYGVIRDNLFIGRCPYDEKDIELIQTLIGASAILSLQHDECLMRMNSVQDKNLNLMNLLINCERYGVNSG